MPNPFSTDVLAPTWAEAFEILKGDFVGHPFRGNQWTAGSVANVANTIASYGKSLGEGAKPSQIDQMITYHQMLAKAHGEIAKEHAEKRDIKSHRTAEKYHRKAANEHSHAAKQWARGSVKAKQSSADARDASTRAKDATAITRVRVAA